MPGEILGPERPRLRLVRAAIVGLAAALVVAGVGALVLGGHLDRKGRERRRLRDLSSRVVTERDADAFIELIEYAESGALPELRPAAAEAWLQTVALVRLDVPEVRGVVLHLRAAGEPAVSAEAERTLASLRAAPSPRTLESLFGKAEAPKLAAAMEGFVERQRDARGGP